MYESEADYNASMKAYGESQAQQEYEYQCYLDDLIEDRQFYLYALEVCQDLFNSRTFKDSGLPHSEYLSKEKLRIINNGKDVDNF